MAEPSHPDSPPTAHPARAPRSWMWAGVVAAIASLVTACKSPPGPGQAPQGASSSSQAGTAREYRKDAARHLYTLNAHRIYAGQLPPMLYAVGVLEVDVDRSGNVRRLHWLRAPGHAPEVVKEIERTVRAAAPFPAPARVSDKLTYTDTWLWDQSGRFQLDTLTEGQRGQ